MARVLSPHWYTHVMSNRERCSWGGDEMKKICKKLMRKRFRTSKWFCGLIVDNDISKMLGRTNSRRIFAST